MEYIILALAIILYTIIVIKKKGSIINVGVTNRAYKK